MKHGVSDPGRPVISQETGSELKTCPVAPSQQRPAKTLVSTNALLLLLLLLGDSDTEEVLEV